MGLINFKPTEKTWWVLIREGQKTGYGYTSAGGTLSYCLEGVEDSFETFTDTNHQEWIDRCFELGLDVAMYENPTE